MWQSQMLWKRALVVGQQPFSTTTTARVLRTNPARRVAGSRYYYTPATTASPWTSCNHHKSAAWFSTAASPKPVASKDKNKRPFPSNLKVDPRSSFAPTPLKSPKLRVTIALDDDNDKKKDKNKNKDAVIVANQDGDHETNNCESDYDSDDEEWMFKPPTAVQVIPLPDRLHAPIYHFGLSETVDQDDDDDDETEESSDDKGDAPHQITTKGNNNNNNNTAEKVGTIWLNETVFGKDPIRIDLLKRCVDYYRAKKRGRRKAMTKRIGDIRGSGRKMRPQKGQGTARAGHRFAAHWRGGAKAHGPRNTTNYGNTKLNKKVRRLAIRHVLSQKLKEGNLVLVNTFASLPSHKTKVLAQWLKPFGIAGRHGTTALLIDHYYPNGDAGEADDNDSDSDDENEEENQDDPVATSFHGVPVNLSVASANLFKLKIGNQLRNINVYDVLKHEKLVLTMDALTALEQRLKED